MTFNGKKMKVAERWAVAQFYYPFLLGSPWEFKRFKVEGSERLYKAGAFQCFLYKRAGLWFAHELTTGGHLGDGKTPRAAMVKARANVARTPDLKEQMKKVGTVRHQSIIDTDEAFRRLKKDKPDG